MEGFVDYFRLLSVDHTAGQADIDAHYRRLCKQFHPDLNREPDAETRMKEINIAYEVLGDSVKRNAYVKEWLRRNAFATARPREESAAFKVMSSYFSALTSGRYIQAYDLLSTADRRNVSYASFEEWQRSVSEIYSIKTFRVKGDQKYESYTLEDRTTCRAERFVIEITEENNLTGKSSRYDFRKFAIEEEGEWHVFLGYRDLSYISEQFRYIANTREEAAILGQWNSYRETTNLNMGLPNRKGFIEKTKPEIYRRTRYKRPFTIAVIKIEVLKQVGGALNGKILTYAGHTLRRLLRITDILGVLDDGVYCVLLAETNARSADKALKRLSERVATEIYNCFDTKVSIAYESDSNASDIATSLDVCRAKA